VFFVAVANLMACNRFAFPEFRVRRAGGAFWIGIAIFAGSMCGASASAAAVQLRAY